MIKFIKKYFCTDEEDYPFKSNKRKRLRKVAKFYGVKVRFFHSAKTISDKILRVVNNY